MLDDLVAVADLTFRKLEDGLVKFPPNVHGLYTEQIPGYLVLVARQNEQRMNFVLDEDARRHLAALLLKDLPPQVAP